MTQTAPMSQILSQYDVLLLDAYGVLVNHAGALPGAADFIDAIGAAKKRYCVVTNDASRLPRTIAQRFVRLGIAIDEAQIVSSGMVLASYFAAENLAGAGCVVVGTPDSEAYVRAAGGTCVPLDAAEAADALIFCDDIGPQMLPTLERVAALAVARLVAGRPLRLILCNPDAIYPKGDRAFGFTTGSMATMVETALEICVPQAPLETRRFVGLGKPNAAIFTAACGRYPGQRLAMVGDQLPTDILGAARAGIDSVLMGTGLTHWDGRRPLTPEPTWFCRSLTAA